MKEYLQMKISLTSLNRTYHKSDSEVRRTLLKWVKEAQELMATMQDVPEKRDEGSAPRFYQGNQTTSSNQGSLCREDIERMVSEHEAR
jgi:hypothetical protein